MSFGISSKQSFRDLQRELNRLSRQAGAVQNQALDEFVATAYPEMLAKAPYETGKLESSIYCRRGSRYKVVAGAQALHKGYNYAYIQHENQDFEHPIKGEAFYIEGPFKDAIERFVKRVREGVK